MVGGACRRDGAPVAARLDADAAALRDGGRGVLRTGPCGQPL